MNQKNNSPILIIDGSFYLYRSYYGIKKLQNNSGNFTNAIYGVINTIKKLIFKYKLHKIIVVFDTKKKNFRNKIYKEYKSNRCSMPKELICQIKPLQKIIKLLGISVIKLNNVEADDIIGTLSYQAKKMNFPVLIATGDKDMIQLITSKIKLISNINNNIIDVQEIKNKYGFKPKLITDFIALMGDSTDNIPGVHGIGQKTARFLVQNIGSLKQIYQNLNKISNIKYRGILSIIKKLKNGKNTAFMSYKLATIKKDVKLNLTNDMMNIKQPNQIALFNIFKKYQFASWIKCLKNHGKNFLFEK